MRLDHIPSSCRPPTFGTLAIARLRAVALLAVCALSLAACIPPIPPATPRTTPGLLPPPPSALANVANPGGPAVKGIVGPVPFPFEKNVGQADPAVQYLLRAGALQASFGTGGIRLVLSDDRIEGAEDAPAPAVPPHVVDLDLVGARAAEPTGSVVSDTLVSYFKGAPDEWLVGVPVFHQVSYTDAWPGIDMHFERSPGVSGLKVTYVVAPGADPAAIRVAWHGERDEVRTIGVQRCRRGHERPPSRPEVGYPRLA